jgi:hypothetical protein
MKKLNVGAVILILASLVLSGCPQPDGNDKPIDPRLEGRWSDGLQGTSLKEFKIEADGSFTASIDPIGGSNDANRGTVKGKLNNEGDEYRMNGLRATLDPGYTFNWGTQVTNPNIAEGQYVKITFDGDKAFNFVGVDQPLITDFFGGHYIWQDTPLTHLP